MPERLRAVTVGCKCHSSWHLPSGRQWLGIGSVPMHPWGARGGRIAWGGSTCRFSVQTQPACPSTIPRASDPRFSRPLAAALQYPALNFWLNDTVFFYNYTVQSEAVHYVCYLYTEQGMHSSFHLLAALTNV